MENITWKELHNYLDIIVAAYITETGKLPSRNSIFDLLSFSGNKVEQESIARNNQLELNLTNKPNNA